MMKKNFASRGSQSNNYGILGAASDEAKNVTAASVCRCTAEDFVIYNKMYNTN